MLLLAAATAVRKGDIPGMSCCCRNAIYFGGFVAARVEWEIGEQSRSKLAKQNKRFRKAGPGICGVRGVREKATKLEDVLSRGRIDLGASMAVCLKRLPVGEVDFTKYSYFLCFNSPAYCYKKLSILIIMQLVILYINRKKRREEKQDNPQKNKK